MTNESKSSSEARQRRWHEFVCFFGKAIKYGLKIGCHCDFIEKKQGKHVGYEINVSCPNINAGGMEFGVKTDMVYKLTSELRKITNKLLFIKLSPNVTNIEEIALSAESAGADGISAVNTFLGTAIDYKTGVFLLSTKFGGVSGSVIKPLALAKIHKIYNQVKIPIIGMGGISKSSDIIEFLRVGSTMVQVGTLNYKFPNAGVSLYLELKNYCKDKGLDSYQELIGKVSYS